MTLTKEQLLEIKAFIEKRGFEQPDVQMEILDHVASNVEDRMNENPALDFNSALIQTHQSFGVMGFSTMADGIATSIKKKYSRIFWRNFFVVFGYKYVLLLCVSIFGIYKLQSMIAKDTFYVFLVIVMLVQFGTSLFWSIKVAGFKKYLSFQSGSSFLVSLGSILFFTNFLISPTSALELALPVHIQQLIASFSIVFYIIYFNAAVKTAKISKRETRALIEKYKLVYS